ncbi:uncharacterized protein K452DRAFT_273556 [Aplosporella prunicola CBS 121167]|uniref:Large ribosomal subunit protein mL38 n=1 Tax=Aplosporella prunicola CBS 121167 TaxID=1176127 RepID=A0A6A6B9P9_9PEZI|nr:uncharacterized protein K452DRAFT_273556 [Aplosporella prunicola CBS 121167]KAF2140756.1 hypothetical protein K452DRAFT_273556 [Aplosporella prunicola CBS 121167]
MPASKQAATQLRACLRSSAPARPGRLSGLTQLRSISNTARQADEAQVQKPAAATEAAAAPAPAAGRTAAPLDPNTVSTRREERKLLRTGVQPIGSRRRRAVMAAGAGNIPFEQLPFQCFQEARSVLAADRAEKIKAIETQRARIERVQAQDAAVSGGDAEKKLRLVSMRNHLEELKILADINDPLVKMRFEDGKGDLNKPIYRYLADRKWRQYKRKVLEQRVSQFYLVPDVLPTLDPVADVSLSFKQRGVPPGDFVDSRVSEVPGTLRVQVFDRGTRLVTIVVVDSDVPNVAKNGFDYRAHFVAANVPISPVAPRVDLGALSTDSQVALGWLPPFAQKGSPYHRLSVWVLQQPEGKELDVAALREGAGPAALKRDGFVLRSFVDAFDLDPVGVTLFRSIWDEGTDGVMKRAGVPGADVEFRREKPLKLPYKKKDGARYR